MALSACCASSCLVLFACRKRCTSVHMSLYLPRSAGVWRFSWRGLLARPCQDQNGLQLSPNNLPGQKIPPCLVSCRTRQKSGLTLVRTLLLKPSPRTKSGEEHSGTCGLSEYEWGCKHKPSCCCCCLLLRFLLTSLYKCFITLDQRDPSSSWASSCRARPLIRAARFCTNLCCVKERRFFD